MIKTIKKISIYLFDKTRELIGFLTLPANAEFSEFKEYWLPILTIDVPLFMREKEGKSIFYPYNYKKLEQNWIGVWRAKDVYLCVYDPVEAAYRSL